jgi:hypothetical protein
MVLVHKTKSYYFASRGEEVQYLNDIGSAFKIIMREPIRIYEDCETLTLQVNTANVWNTSPNISDVNNNNHFYIEYGASGIQDILIENGLYGVSELNNYLQQKFKELGFPEDLITITGDSSTQKTIISFNYDNTTIYWNSDSCWEIMGFNEGTTTTAPAGTNVYGDVVAEFNRISSYYIKSNLTTDGIPINNLNPGLIVNIPITAKPGSLINFEPVNPLSCSGKKLKQGIQTVEFTLLDQLLRPCIMDEIWEFSVVIKYSYFKKDKTLN